MTDLQEKYQKLASEYSKLRCHLPILKKAVLEEQAKQENLKELLNEKDQAVRKYQQEVDSLMFRNQQLLARVSILQSELEETRIKHKKHKWSSDPPVMLPINNSIIGEELQGKIEENARLHTLVYENEQRHMERVGELEGRLRGLESNVGQHERVLHEALEKRDTEISKLQTEKAMLQVDLQKLETQSKQATRSATISEDRLRCVEENLNEQLEESTRLIHDKLKFIDTKRRDWSALNLPPVDRPRQLTALRLCSEARGLLARLTRALADFYSYSEQRCKAFAASGDSPRLSDVNSKYCAHLRSSDSFIRPMEQSFSSFCTELKDESLITLETVEGLGDFAVQFNNFVQYASRLLPYQLLSIEEECSVSTCTNALNMKNMDLHAATKRYSAALTSVATYVSTVAAQSQSDYEHLTTSPAKLFKLLAQALAAFHEATKDVSKHFNAKVSLEHQLPTATQSLKVTDECIVSSLVNQVAVTGKLSTFFLGNMDFLCESVDQSAAAGVSRMRSHPVVSMYHQRAAAYLHNIQSASCPEESVPYCESLHNRNMLFSSTEGRDSLAQQVVVTKEKLCQLEQEKELWLLEAELQKIKFEKQNQRILHLEKHLANDGSIEGNLDLSLAPPTCALTNNVDTPHLGSISQSTRGELDEETSAIKRHFSDRISSFISQAQLTDSKAVYFHSECRAVHRHLTVAKKDIVDLEETVKTANGSILHLKDELSTTTNSYKGQLSTMSEHLASMNEQLARQQDEIDFLKYEKNNLQANKKGRGK